MNQNVPRVFSICSENLQCMSERKKFAAFFLLSKFCYPNEISQFVFKYAPKFRFNIYPEQNTFNTFSKRFLYSGTYYSIHIVTGTLFFNQNVSSMFSMCTENLRGISERKYGHIFLKLYCFQKVPITLFSSLINNLF